MDADEDVLFQAILDKDTKTVAERIARGDTALSKNSCGEMAIHFACLNSNLEALKLLKDTLNPGYIDTINIEEDDDTICGTALHMSMDGQVDEKVVQLLLEWGANPNATDAKGSPVLHELVYRAWEDFQDDFASEESMWEDFDETCLQSGDPSLSYYRYPGRSDETCFKSDVPSPSDYSFPDRHDQENCNSSDSDDYKGQSYFRKLSMLVQYGADINLQHEHTSMSPFHFWCQNLLWDSESKTESAIPKWCKHFLLRMIYCGADPNVLNDRGETPVHYLSQRHYKPSHNVFMDSYKDIVSLVLPKVTDINRVNMYGRTLLQCGVEHSNIVLVKLLLESSADVNHQDKFGLSPAHLITHNVTHDESALVEGILHALIASKADINIQDNHGLTPLHHAIHLNNLTALMILLNEGVQVNTMDTEGRTALDVANILKNETGLKLLDFVNATHTSQVVDDYVSLKKGETEQHDNNSSIQITPTDSSEYMAVVDKNVGTMNDNKSPTASLSTQEQEADITLTYGEQESLLDKQDCTMSELVTETELPSDNSFHEMQATTNNQTCTVGIFSTEIPSDSSLSDNEMESMSGIETQTESVFTAFAWQLEDNAGSDNKTESLSMIGHKSHMINQIISQEHSANGTSFENELEEVTSTKTNRRSSIEQENEQNTDMNVTSDVSRGWYFPLCCHKRYSAENAWSEHIERVQDSLVDEWLKKYPMCEHNNRAILQNAVSDLQTNTEQVLLDIRDEHSMKTEIYDLAVKVSKHIATFNPLFESRVIFGGSVSEGTKIGACDEFDLVFDLWKLREYTDIVELQFEQLKGFVRLKINNSEEFVNKGMSHLVDDHGFLNRVNTSVEFHNCLERALRMDNVWCDTSYFSFWGTTNSAGECSNIGQLKLVWYGPWCVRQDVSVDIAPVIRVPGWLPGNCQSNVQIVDQEVMKTIGCYLMMKDASRYIDEPDSDSDFMESGVENDTNEEGIDSIGQGMEATLFKISVSQVEHATMRNLPSVIKIGYKIAKGIQLQCPAVLFLLSDMIMSQLPCGRIDIDSANPKGGFSQIRGIVYVGEYLTSYVLKTGLFHELHRRGIRMTFEEADVRHENWNWKVIDEPSCRPVSLTKADVTAAMGWATEIYKRLLDQVEQHNKISEYFLPAMEATKVSGDMRSFTKITSTFLKILIYLLENYSIPDDISLSG